MGVPVLSGLPSLPEQSTLQNFISQIAMENSETFIKEMGKASKRMGLIKGRIVNLDTHYSAYWGDSEIGKDKHPTRNKSLPGERTNLDPGPGNNKSYFSYCQISRWQSSGYCQKDAYIHKGDRERRRKFFSNGKSCF
ncbi:MAG: hypothetical protein COZ37_01660 [bacterium (Candidatus Ratteibacteria) CG_4_10_14_3_um_filter_41_18]|uniref:Uncharacterized protein n=3 Tax=Candidatus Ratteibacteria TaxID=2979319 RepID=A0A2M7YEY2_9BACT|nr:MAG: hypothetical protein COS11_05830 [bacterium (Candidatus Ratteibacteria) CG01_land_8_20_14_3_00_40_19]PIW73912.1 MAG: hypothetical protein CO004_03465 [bacterium (Candidatus Ratteibacteria) CG_4_8_14_3_um_filter_41_36]PIX77635.1 MAG: hypothetical protein COZ37_01660 [bacterium (Candidatus Ratteibacteria) CG_4_10_14_3_um_filter_41_18]PJA61516.1 MAG: hypothetical protein CO162_05890 [bacterium (Candidatus Ratteibacteria) CG_4_9_14_3_um_filter_41_21]